MLGYGRTDIGCVRPKNEDSIYVSNEPVGKLDNLYIVADGMGGHRAGQVASNTAIEAFLAYLNKYQPDSTDEPLDMIIGAVNMANDAVYKLGRTYEEYSEMGTTIIGATVVGNNMYVAHVGDSRLYKISDGKIEQVTNDHSLVAEMVRAGQITEEEARNHPQRNCITRAVGTDSSVVTDGLIVKVKENDIILICSDGLSTMLEDDEICNIASAGGFSLEDRASMLVEALKKMVDLTTFPLLLLTFKEVSLCKLEKGQVISDRYKIVETLGRGGMAIVYKANDLKLGRDVTFKVLKSDYIEDKGFIKRFNTEARAVHSLPTLTLSMSMMLAMMVIFIILLWNI